jgi:hypothetical protein
MEGQMVTRRSLAELVATDDPAWPLVEEWTAGASNRVEVLARVEESSEQALEYLQVTLRSPLGAVAYHTGGILVDGGWLRLLGGGGGQRMVGGLKSWNDGSVKLLGPAGMQALIVAHDVAGGFFALDGGMFGGRRGGAHYLAQDTLEWEDLDLSYSDLLLWAFTGDLEGYYTGSRWPGWQEETQHLPGDEGMLIYPPLWAAEGGQLAERVRRIVPMTELWAATHAWRAQQGP